MLAENSCQIFISIIFILLEKAFLCPHKSYPNKQSDAKHGNWNGCQVITQKRGNSSNSFDFNEVYFLCRF